MVNAQLKAQNAQTDDAQAAADATRTLAQGKATAEVDEAQGDKTLNSDVGAAAVTRAQGAATLDTDTGKAEDKKASGVLGTGIGGNS